MINRPVLAYRRVVPGEPFVHFGAGVPFGTRGFIQVNNRVSPLRLGKVKLTVLRSSKGHLEIKARIPEKTANLLCNWLEIDKHQRRKNYVHRMPWHTNRDIYIYQTTLKFDESAHSIDMSYDMPFRSDNILWIDIDQIGEYTITIPPCTQIDILGFPETKIPPQILEESSKYAKLKENPLQILQMIAFPDKGFLYIHQENDKKITINLEIGISKNGIVIEGPGFAEDVSKPSWATTHSRSNWIIIKLSIPGDYKILIPVDADLRVNCVSNSANIDYTSSRKTYLTVAAVKISKAYGRSNGYTSSEYQMHHYSDFGSMLDPLLPITDIVTNGYVELPKMIVSHL
ncbi:MAG: hypothetical protein Hyperionvirus4_20 [Hyperionvirus sp.]|uniref:Uncharacterized protein n=1 Tax=Hyperionvirus sp. TaxID=2487770 RepID=A0A3G5A737_9VIRU|nr:MAG: hypothetical protein Hyperionvirus4_20 [Hyperionvirus sp.]